MQSGGPPPGKQYRFNSPPGWPTYPPEWVPPPGWQPDPRWPPAPPGWPFWSEIAAPEKKPRKTLTRAVQVTVAVVSFTATVVGLVAAIKTWPKGVSESDWAKKANATCEKYFGDVVTPTLAVVPQIAAATADNGSDPSKFTQISAQLAGISSGFGKMTSELDGLDAPKNHEDVDNLIKAGRAMSAEFGDLAAAMTAEVTDTEPAKRLADTQAAMKDLQQISDSARTWGGLATTLQLDQCQGFASFATTPTPGPVSPTPPAPLSPTPGQLTGAQLALVARIKSSVLTGCRPTTQAPPLGTVAVNCNPVAAGPTKMPAVIQFTSQAAMNQWMSTNWQSSVTGLSTDCAQGNYNREWTSPATNNQRAGQVVCKQTASNDFTMAWTFDTALIGVVAEGPDGATIFQWWKNNAYLVATS